MTGATAADLDSTSELAGGQERHQGDEFSPECCACHGRKSLAQIVVGTDEYKPQGGYHRVPAGPPAAEIKSRAAISCV